MRNDLMALDGSTTANAAATGHGRSCRRRTMRRGLLALPLALVLTAGSATTALAVEPTSGYSQTSPAPKTTTTTTTTPKGEAAPTTTSNTASKETSAPNNRAEPTATTTTTKATTLPFTGLDLRWVILAGVLLVGMGMSIVVVQRGRHGTGR